MKKSKFSIARKDEEMDALIEQCDHKTLGVWAKTCAERVLAYFETEFPEDDRPRQALETLQEWIDTGKFSMKVIRKASLDAHAAAREVGADSPARSAARAAGQAVATAHVRTHAPGAAIYAQQAVHRAVEVGEEDSAVAEERAWQIEELERLVAKSSRL